MSRPGVDLKTTGTSRINCYSNIHPTLSTTAHLVIHSPASCNRRFFGGGGSVQGRGRVRFRHLINIELDTDNALNYAWVWGGSRPAILTGENDQMTSEEMGSVIVYSEALLNKRSITKVRKLADELTGPEILYLINLQMAWNRNWFMMYSGICKKNRVQISGDVSHVTMNGNTVQFNMEGAEI